MEKIYFDGNADKEFAKLKEFNADELKFFEFRQKQIQIDKLMKINSNMSIITRVIIIQIILAIIAAISFVS